LGKKGRGRYVRIVTICDVLAKRR